MTRKLLVLLLPLILLFFVSNVGAQTANTGNAPTATTPAAIDAATKLKLQMQLVQDQKTEVASKAREDAKVIIQAKRDEFKAKLQLIKDQKKRALVERIDAKLAEVNIIYTAKFLEVLSRLQLFLEDYVQSASGNITTTVLAKITIAQTAIDTAKTAVDAQAEKSYTMNITDDSSLKLNAGATVSLLRQELTAIYKMVVDAKQAVQNLNTEKGSIKKEATNSAE